LRIADFGLRISSREVRNPQSALMERCGEHLGKIDRADSGIVEGCFDSCAPRLTLQVGEERGGIENGLETGMGRHERSSSSRMRRKVWVRLSSPGLRRKRARRSRTSSARGRTIKRSFSTQATSRSPGLTFRARRREAGITTRPCRSSRSDSSSCLNAIPAFYGMFIRSTAQSAIAIICDSNQSWAPVSTQRPARADSRTASHTFWVCKPLRKSGWAGVPLSMPATKSASAFRKVCS